MGDKYSDLSEYESIPLPVAARLICDAPLSGKLGSKAKDVKRIQVNAKDDCKAGKTPSLDMSKSPPFAPVPEIFHWAIAKYNGLKSFPDRRSFLVELCEKRKIPPVSLSGELRIGATLRSTAVSVADNQTREDLKKQYIQCSSDRADFQEKLIKAQVENERLTLLIREKNNEIIKLQKQLYEQEKAKTEQYKKISEKTGQDWLLKK